MKIKDIINRESVNLVNCDQEPIHIPGSIQPHGFLIGLNKSTFEIQFCSGNIKKFLNLDMAEILGKSVTDIFGPGCSDNLKELKTTAEGVVKTFKVIFSGSEFEFAAHAYKNAIILECEDAVDEQRESIDVFSLSKQFLSYMEDSRSLRELCALVADGIQRITGYDRVMIYRFDEEYNGEVIAENKREDLESFLGLHYPHTDIPAQARELYIQNLLRIIADVNYSPVPLYTLDDGSDKNLDLSYSVLRSVSPIHIQYLHNMGVGATLTISLIHKKKLWGLISCHHYSPKYLGLDLRTAVKLQGHFITSQIDIRELNEDYELSKKITESASELIAKKVSLDRKSFMDMVSDPNLLLLCNASGAAILIDNQIYKTGLTPGDEDIRKLASYLSVYSANTSFHTIEFSKVLADFKSFSERIPGINYYALDLITLNCIIWFRGESIMEVKWAGDPGKAIEKNSGGLSPRKSFEVYKEIVKHRSKPWRKAELTASSDFASIVQKHLSAICLTEEEEKQRNLAAMLIQTNAELENINWISTHDLQEPLRKIQVMGSMILHENIDPREVHSIVTKMSKSALRMQNLITDILKYTRLNYSNESFQNVDLNHIVADVSGELNEGIASRTATVDVDTLPQIKGVSFLLQQLFSNLFYNSLKFYSTERPLKIRISSSTSTLPDSPQLYHVICYSDNGIGFEENFNESIFNIFAKLHSPSLYPGSGIGLALCKKIMITHKGFIKADGVLHQGATFRLYFPVTE